MNKRLLRRVAAMLILCAACTLNGCKKPKAEGALPPPPPPGSTPANPAGDIAKNGAVLVFPRPLTGPISINFSK